MAAARLGQEARTEEREREIGFSDFLSQCISKHWGLLNRDLGLTSGY